MSTAHIIGKYNATPPSLTDGQTVQVRVTSAGALVTDASGSSASITSVVPGTGATNLGKAEDAAHTSGDVGVMGLGVVNETLAELAGTEGDYVPAARNKTGVGLGEETMVDQFVDNTNAVAATQHKPLAVSTYTYTIDKSAALEASTIVNAGPCNLRLISGRIDSTAPTATYYLQRINSTTLPADGAVTLLDAPTKLQHVTGTDTPVLIDYTMNCLNASTGGVICLSTTDFTKTISGAYLSLTVMYKA